MYQPQIFDKKSTASSHSNETLLQKVKKSKTQGNSQKLDFKTHHKYHFEISRLNEKFPRPAIF